LARLHTKISELEDEKASHEDISQQQKEKAEEYPHQHARHMHNYTNMYIPQALSVFNNVLRIQARQILNDIRGSSHTYGRIKHKNESFLIDTSGSMRMERQGSPVAPAYFAVFNIFDVTSNNVASLPVTLNVIHGPPNQISAITSIPRTGFYVTFYHYSELLR
jgi:hypothetical protein